jgi:hypothetical protein
MRVLWLLFFMTTAFAECKPVSSSLKLTPEKGLIIKLDDKPFHLTGLTFLKTEDYTQAVTWLSELSEARHGELKGLNRYGAETATLFHGEDPIAAAFLRVGIAIRQDGGDCADVLKQAENDAIKNKAGIWGSLKQATDPELHHYIGQYMPIRGTVLSARKAKQGVYINFSRDFKTSLSGYIFEKNIDKIDWQSLQGKNVILKGVITKMQGLQIVVNEPSQITVE